MHNGLHPSSSNTLPHTLGGLVMLEVGRNDRIADSDVDLSYRKKLWRKNTAKFEYPYKET